jgi:hypothetical protein
MARPEYIKSAQVDLSYMSYLWVSARNSYER